MDSKLHISNTLENLYISPLEACNLNCKHCYTTKTPDVLSNHQILDFVNKYSHFVHKSYSIDLKSIMFCGGEVFILPNFPDLVSRLLSQNIFISIITNGTIDRLPEIVDPKNCQLIVSLDGPKDIHDANRGNGNFDKSIKFIDHALSLGFPVHIFYLVTKDSYTYIDSFPSYLSKALNLQIPKTPDITYLPDRLGSLTLQQTLNLVRNYPTYPSKNFGCYQISLQSNGYIYGCCESNQSIGNITDSIESIVDNFHKLFPTCNQCELGATTIFPERSEREDESIEDEPEGSEYRKKFVVSQNHKCAGCCQPSYFCGLIKQLNCQSCQSVIKSL